MANPGQNNFFDANLETFFNSFLALRDSTYVFLPIFLPKLAGSHYWHFFYRTFNVFFPFLRKYFYFLIYNASRSIAMYPRIIIITMTPPDVLTTTLAINTRMQYVYLWYLHSTKQETQKKHIHISSIREGISQRSRKALATRRLWGCKKKKKIRETEKKTYRNRRCTYGNDTTKKKKKQYIINTMKGNKIESLFLLSEGS